MFRGPSSIASFRLWSAKPTMPTIHLSGLERQPEQFPLAGGMWIGLPSKSLLFRSVILIQIYSNPNYLLRHSLCWCRWTHSKLCNQHFHEHMPKWVLVPCGCEHGHHSVLSRWYGAWFFVIMQILLNFKPIQIPANCQCPPVKVLQVWNVSTMILPQKAANPLPIRAWKGIKTISFHWLDYCICIHKHQFFPPFASGLVNWRAFLLTVSWWLWCARIPH